MCFKNVIAAEVAATVSSSPKHFAFSTSFADFQVVSRHAANMVLYMFSSPYCALVQAEGHKLECPTHGKLTVTEVAPDLVSTLYFTEVIDLFVQEFTVFLFMFTVYCLLFTVYCLLFTIYYLLFM